MNEKTVKDCVQTRTPTKEWLKEQIEDERKAEKMYCDYGFPLIASDEARHRKILEEFLG